MTFLYDIRKNAVQTLQTGTVIDEYNWNIFCSILKKNSYIDNISIDQVFELMIHCCILCQKDMMYHDEEDHDSCCDECSQQQSKTENIIPFVMKNYYHAHKRYYNDCTDIWFLHDQKPVVYKYEVVNTLGVADHDLYNLCTKTCACCNCFISFSEFNTVWRYIV
jgi:hypothetical protein